MGARKNTDLHLGPPDTAVVREMRMMLLHQFTYTGAPHIWSGDELGMWGADDPDCRKPVIWDDIKHRPQVFTPDGQRHEPFPVKPDTELRSYYKTLIALRKKRRELVGGGLEFVVANDNDMTLAYRRELAGRETIVAFNLSGQVKTVSLTADDRLKSRVLLESSPGSVAGFRQNNRKTEIKLNPYSGVALGDE
jgi:glycosidase